MIIGEVELWDTITAVAGSIICLFAVIKVIVFLLELYLNRKSKNGKSSKSNGNSVLRELFVSDVGKELNDFRLNTCNKMQEMVHSLSAAMYRHIELQQSSLKVDEYKYEATEKQLERLIHAVDSMNTEIAKTRNTLEAIKNNIIDESKLKNNVDPINKALDNIDTKVDKLL